MYHDVGGMDVIEKIVDDFYEIMSTDPLARNVFATHMDRDIKESAKKLKTLPISVKTFPWMRESLSTAY